MKEETLRCPLCGRIMLLVKNTFLCPVCDSSIIWDLNTPNTTKEERSWVEKNLGRNNDTKK